VNAPAGLLDRPVDVEAQNTRPRFSGSDHRPNRHARRANRRRCKAGSTTTRGTCGKSGLFLNNRHYDPSTGVFTSVEPLVSKTMQPYVYGAANPVTYSDPSGLDPDTRADVRAEAERRGYCTYSSSAENCGGVLTKPSAKPKTAWSDWKPERTNANDPSYRNWFAYDNPHRRPTNLRGRTYVGGYCVAFCGFGPVPVEVGPLLPFSFEAVGNPWAVALSACYFGCLKLGYSSEEGLYSDVGVGLAFDMPSVGLEDQPQCGGESNEFFLSGGAGPGQIGGSWSFSDGGTIQSGDGAVVAGMSATPSDWRSVSPGVGGGFVHWWTFC